MKGMYMLSISSKDVKRIHRYYRSMMKVCDRYEIDSTIINGLSDSENGIIVLCGDIGVAPVEITEVARCNPEDLFMFDGILCGDFTSEHDDINGIFPVAYFSLLCGYEVREMEIA